MVTACSVASAILAQTRLCLLDFDWKTRPNRVTTLITIAGFGTVMPPVLFMG